MADGSFGERDIVIDLAVTGARVIRDATKSELVKIAGITISGTAGASNGGIVLRKESASGAVVFQFQPGVSAVVAFNEPFTKPKLICKGLYMDTQTTAWAAGAIMVIHTA